MNSSEQIAMDLLKRLLEGERGLVSVQLGMLLEKSARLARGDAPKQVENAYNTILPPEYYGISLSPKSSEEVIAQLCTLVSLDPDHGLISALAASGSKPAIRTLVRVMADPPRTLKPIEIVVAFSYLSTFLPIFCAESLDFVSHEEITGLSKLAEEVLVREKFGGDEVERKAVREQAARLLERLPGGMSSR